uniref:Tripartite motif-containing protein 59 n=1 Tax=Magallana gigas TaxID=29159 RepID=K1RH54_MAGGI
MNDNSGNERTFGLKLYTMAAGKEKQVSFTTEETTTCPICFESFLTPRYLPCSHTFCHSCLSSYILSTGKTKDCPVGFPCPLCRSFVPASSFSVELEKWSELIPINKSIQVLIEKGDRLCDACQREDEEIVGNLWCESCSDTLCAMCAKYHKRNAAFRSHMLVPIADFSKVSGKKEGMEPTSVVCKDHSKLVKYICVDHEELCCTKCVCTKHRNCTQVDDIEDAAESLRKSEKIKTLSEEISQFESSLVKAKSDGEDTIRYIDNTSDQIKKESTELRDKIVNHVNALLEDHLSELAQNAKEHKGSVASCVDAVSNRQLLVTQYLYTLENTEKAPASVLVNEYLKIKKQFAYVTKSGFSQMRVQLQSTVSKDLAGILHVKTFTDLRTHMKSIPLCGIDLTNANMKLICELPGSTDSITGGCFLENGDIVLVDNDSSHLLHYSNAVLIRTADLIMEPHDAVCQNNSLLISLNPDFFENEKSSIIQFNLDKFEKNKDEFLTEASVYSMAISGGFIYVACSDVIKKI